MNLEIRATIYYFLIALVCFSVSSLGAYIADEKVGTILLSLTLIIIPLITFYFITKQTFKKEITNV